jgi:hypothetical protein
VIHFRLYSLTVVIALASPGASALGQEIETPAGIVEFIGLHSWTIPMIQDSMKVHAPGQPLGRCAAVLRALGFPSAESLYTSSSEGRSSTLVILVEPQDSSLVRYRRLPARARASLKAWGPAYRILRNDVAAYQTGAQTFGIHAVGDSAREHLILSSYPNDSAQVRAFWRFLEWSRDAQTADLAERTLLEDASVENRILAAAVLGAQRGRVRAWYALVKGLRDPDERVAAAAEMGLTSLLTGPQSRIDWRPALADIRAILDGTNVLGLRTTLVALTKTQIDPTLAPALLRENGGLVMDLLGSHSPAHRDAAHEFLVRLAGKDLGPSPENWKIWLQGVHARASWRDVAASKHFRMEAHRNGVGVLAADLRR